MIAIALITAFVCPPAQRLQVDLKEWKKQGAPLAVLGMKPAACEKKSGIDLFDANLSGEGDHVVQVRFRCGGERALRIAVLVPLADGAMCKLDGEDLSTDLAPGEKRILDFIELTRPGRKVIQVNDQSAASAQTAFYEVQGWSLKKIFSSQVLETLATASGPLPERWTLEFGTDLPKTIRAQRCVEGAPCDDPEDFIYAKAGGKYVKK